jgi:hypothetical protein
MHRALIAAALILPLVTGVCSALAGSAEVLGQAGTALENGDAQTAAHLLERALLTASPTERKQFLPLLRRAYEQAVQQAEAEGRTREAAAYRDNLSILDRKRPATATPAPTPSARPQAQQPSVAATSSPPPLLSPSPSPSGVERSSYVDHERYEPIANEPSGGPTPPQPNSDEPPPARERFEPLGPPPARERLEPLGLPEPPADEPGRPVSTRPESTIARASEPEPDLASADAAFRAQKYDEAGRIYAALARANRLPKSRNDHWVYCRCADVVRRINANPRTAQEWSAIQAEIQQIRALSPQNWYGEYLRNLATERSTGAPKNKKPSNQMVIRGAAPDESTAPELVSPASPIPLRPRTSQAGPSRPAPTFGNEEPDRVAQPSSAIGNWQVLMTPNFRILHADAALAERVARTAETARDEQTRRWTGKPPRGGWAPRCDIYLYPSASLFARMTGQPEDSPGFSTMGLNGGKIVARRMNLRADHPNLLAAIVPHEVTHVVLADLFPDQQIPRWADEGMAVLAEPTSEQHLRAADLAEPLASGRLFRVDQLMVMDYPEGQHWALYYAQSVSLTRYLVELGTPVQFVQFLQASQRGNPEQELRRIYQIEGFAELQRRWVAAARSAPTAATASANGRAQTPAERRRE